jgi:hypothetical protein
MKKSSISVALGVSLLAVTGTALAALGKVSASASISGTYSTSGGQPHYNISATATAKETSVSSSKVKEIYVIAGLYRNDEKIKTGSIYDTYTTSVSKSFSTTEYGTGNYEVLAVAKTTYTDNSTDEDKTGYAAKKFSVQ